MSNWKITSAVFALTLVSCAHAVEGKYIELLDGKAVTEIAISGDTVVSFDGKSELLIDKAGIVLRVPARTPSVLHISPSRTLALLNYGDGSGQVYDIAVYRLSDGREIDTQQFRSSLRDYASDHGCIAAPDAASIVFKKWMSADQIEVATEDFSRTTNCSALNRIWTIDLRRKAKS